MRKITLAFGAICLLFTLNSSVVARASTPQPLWTGTNMAKLAELLARAENLFTRQR